MRYMKRSWKRSKNTIKIAKIRNLEIPYVVEHRRVKYPRIEFKSDKLLIILPYNMQDETEVLTKKEDWISKKMKEIDKNIEYAEKYKKKIGEKNLIFGEFYDVRFTNGRYNISIDKDQIEVSTPKQSTGLVYLKNWLKEELRKRIISYLNEFSGELGVNYKKVFIRTQKTKWASCSSKGNLSFNLKLAALPEELIKYTVTHETVHLKENNHSKNFWRIMEGYFPDYKEKEALLAGFWFLIDKDELWRKICSLPKTN